MTRDPRFWGNGGIDPDVPPSGPCSTCGAAWTRPGAVYRWHRTHARGCVAPDHAPKGSGANDMVSSANDLAPMATIATAPKVSGANDSPNGASHA